MTSADDLAVPGARVDSGLAALRPTTRSTVMSLVARAGVDVSEWAAGDGGAAKAASNPRFCYEWAFERPGQLAVLTVWFESVERAGGELVVTDNLRALAERLEYEPTRSTQLLARRARRFDETVARAAAGGLPVRVILVEGRREQASSDEASRVMARTLDEVVWAVRSYDVESGAFILARAATPEVVVDQFEVAVRDEDAPAATRVVATVVRERSVEVRRKVLKRAAGLCEWCSAPGFRMANGAIYLETHHVIPLAEDGPDVETNVIALCANHHREAHHGVDRDVMRVALGRIARMKVVAGPLAV